MKKRKLRFPFKIISISLLCLGAIFFLLFFSARYLTTSDYFKIKDSADYFAGKNIFKINLQKEAQRLSRLYPDYKRVVLRLLLPNRIIVNFIPRQAVALLSLPDRFYVDKEGVLFRLTSGGDEHTQLPLIIGLKARITNPQSGVKYNDNSLLATLDFIDNLNKDKNLSKNLKIKEVNLANTNNVFLFTSTDCKINLGGIESLNKDLLILQRLISEINSDLTKLKYIDLRFREPIVKYR